MTWSPPTAPRAQRRESGVSSRISAAPTTVTAPNDMLHRYEQLLLQLSHQLLEQEEDIRILRKALAATSQQEQGRRGQCDLVDAVSDPSCEPMSTPRSQRTQHTATRAPNRMGSAHTHSQQCLTPLLAEAPQVSSIKSTGHADAHSITGDSLVCATKTSQRHQRTPAGAPAPLEARPSGRLEGKEVSVVHTGRTMLKGSRLSDNTDLGLTPSVVCECSRSGEVAPAEACRTPSFSLARATTGNGNSPIRCRLTTAQLARHAKLESSQATFDDQGAMSYLLSVFSSVETKVTPGVSSETPCKKATRAYPGVLSPNAPPQQHRSHAARQLFPSYHTQGENEDSEIEDEQKKSASLYDLRSPAPQQTPRQPYCDTQGNKNSGALGTHKVVDALGEGGQCLEYRYARMVACALAAEFTTANPVMKNCDAECQQQHRIDSSRCTPVAARCHSTPARHDYSASEMVAELLHLLLTPAPLAPAEPPVAAPM